MADLMTTDSGAALDSQNRPPAVFGNAENSQNLMFCDLVQQHFTAALQDKVILPKAKLSRPEGRDGSGQIEDLDFAAVAVPVSQPPGDAQAETWITFNEIAADSKTAGNAATRMRHLVQLHAWTHSDDDEHRTAFFMAIELLKAAGVRVFSWGADDYEQDTGIHHIACTCEWWQL